ncbi:MAG: 3-hydroxyacyl-ACP dehydratase FabZ family protein [Sulfuricaulis sp.]
MPRADFSFAADHPAFSGHFPDRPIVPGVLLIDALQRIIESSSGLVLVGLATAKFLSPVTPDEPLTADYEVILGVVHFDIHSGNRKVAIGRFSIAKAIPGVPDVQSFR